MGLEITLSSRVARSTDGCSQTSQASLLKVFKGLCLRCLSGELEETFKSADRNAAQERHWVERRGAPEPSFFHSSQWPCNTGRKRTNRLREVMTFKPRLPSGEEVVSGQIPVLWLNLVWLLTHDAVRSNDIGTSLSPLVDRKLFGRLTYILIVFEWLILSTVPFAQQLFANFAGSHWKSWCQYCGAGWNPQTQTAHSKEKAVVNWTVGHPCLKGTGKKGWQVVTEMPQNQDG